MNSGKNIVRRLAALAAAVLLGGMWTAGAEEAGTVPGIWAAIGTETPAQLVTPTPAPDAFRFREGIRWGMNPRQVKALESEGMTERTLQDWTVMVTTEKVAVSRFTADLVFMFYQEQLRMITYEFQRQQAGGDYAYLTGALSTLYGEKAEAAPATVKNLMDAVYPQRYRLDQITEPWGWTAADGTAVFLYYYSAEGFAIMYVSPELGAGLYQTNGL